MSKKIIILILVASSCIGFAQDTLSKLAIETQFNLKTQDGYIPQLKLRYFLSDKGAVRLTANLNQSSNLREIYELNGQGVGTVEKINNSSLLGIGYEHFFSQNKITSYFGASFLWGIGRSDVYGSRTDSTTFIADYKYSSKSPFNNYGFELFSGVDVNVYKGFYVGAEIGVKYLATITKEGEYKAEDASSSTADVITSKIPAQTVKSLGLNGLGVIRIGWRL